MNAILPYMVTITYHFNLPVSIKIIEYNRIYNNHDKHTAHTKTETLSVNKSIHVFMSQQVELLLRQPIVDRLLSHSDCKIVLVT